MFFKSKKEKQVDLTEEIKKLMLIKENMKQDVEKLEKTLNFKKDDFDNLTAKQEKLKENLENKKKNLDFIKTIESNTINDYVDITLEKIYITNDGFDDEKLRRYFLYFNLAIRNKTPYHILAIKVIFNIENLFGDTMVCNFSLNSNKKIYPSSIIIDSNNELLRWGTDYQKSSSSFIMPYDLENIVRDNNSLETLVLKVQSINLALLIDGEKKIIDVDKYHKYNFPKEKKIPIPIKKEVPSTLKNTLNKIKPVENIPKCSIKLKSGDDISRSRLAAIKKLLKKNLPIRPVLSCYSPLKKGGVVVTDSYSLFILGYDYLPLNVAFSKLWNEKDKKNYLINYKNKIENVTWGEYPDIKNLIYDEKDSIDIISFNRNEIIEENKQKKQKIEFITKKGYHITLSVELLFSLIKILNIKDETFTGYFFDAFKPVIVYNEDDEMGLVLPIKTF